jgi:hypothetical protein
MEQAISCERLPRHDFLDELALSQADHFFLTNDVSLIKSFTKRINKENIKINIIRYITNK